MLEAGVYQRLTVSRISNHGLYLTDEEGNEVLLPNRYVSLADKAGDEKEVFVYHDSEDRLVATTERPLAVVGEAAYMKTVDTNAHGAFLDWGLSAKDLFVPHRKQTVPMEPGRHYVVYVYRDDRTGRAVATARLQGYISNENVALEPGSEVEILIANELPIGYRVIVNHRHWGMLYKNQLYRPVSVGDRMTAYVRKVTDDHRVDVSLQQSGFDEVVKSADKLLTLIREGGGRLPVGDDSTPEKIAAVAGMSKKVFKRSVGNLLKQGVIVAESETIRLSESAPEGVR